MEKLGLLQRWCWSRPSERLHHEPHQRVLAEVHRGLRRPHLQPRQVKRVHVERVDFDYDTRRWNPGTSCFHGTLAITSSSPRAKS